MSAPVPVPDKPVPVHRLARPIPSELLTDPVFIGRFWGMVRKEPSGCWTWLGAMKSRPYLVVRVSGEREPNGQTRRITLSAARVACALLSLEWAQDKVMNLGCNNPACVNPEHMILSDFPHVASRKGKRRYPPRPGKEVCKNGHAMTPGNTRVHQRESSHGTGRKYIRRICKKCEADKTRRSRRKPEAREKQRQRQKIDRERQWAKRVEAKRSKQDSP